MKATPMADVAWRRANASIAGASILVIGLVAWLLTQRTPASGAVPSAIASFNAVMNGATVLALVTGYWLVRRGRREAHRRAMLAALVTSLGFLIGYVIHHAQVGSVRFHGTGTLRTTYFLLLIPHVVLAAVEVPLVLFTLRLALAQRFEQHRRLARWTLPIWLFVSASGVAVYFMLYWL